MMNDGLEGRNVEESSAWEMVELGAVGVGQQKTVWEEGISEGVWKRRVRRNEGTDGNEREASNREKMREGG